MTNWTRDALTSLERVGMALETFGAASEESQADVLVAVMARIPTLRPVMRVARSFFFERGGMHFPGLHHEFAAVKAASYHEELLVDAKKPEPIAQECAEALAPYAISQLSALQFLDAIRRGQGTSTQLGRRADVYAAIFGSYLEPMPSDLALSDELVICEYSLPNGIVLRALEKLKDAGAGLPISNLLEQASCRAYLRGTRMASVRFDGQPIMSITDKGREWLRDFAELRAGPTMDTLEPDDTVDEGELDGAEIIADLLNDGAQIHISAEHFAMLAPWTKGAPIVIESQDVHECLVLARRVANKFRGQT